MLCEYIKKEIVPCRTLWSNLGEGKGGLVSDGRIQGGVQISNEILFLKFHTNVSIFFLLH